ncbi:MAG: methylated-DNA--[protein]-cysteine S-methyltransferase [Vicinamibacterales bacterium]
MAVVSDPPTLLVAERLQTPIGELILVTDETDRVRALEWEDLEPRLQRLLRLHYGRPEAPLTARAAPSLAWRALQEYFEGQLERIDAVPVATGGTPFQRMVWTALRTIPAGHTMSYSELAIQIGRPAAVRAVGLANGANPIGVIVPCHRVVGRNAALTGYAGGLERKAWLLAHEGARQESFKHTATARASELAQATDDASSGSRR